MLQGPSSHRKRAAALQSVATAVERAERASPGSARIRASNSFLDWFAKTGSTSAGAVKKLHAYNLEM